MGVVGVVVHARGRWRRVVEKVDTRSSRTNVVDGGDEDLAVAPGRLRSQSSTRMTRTTQSFHSGDKEILYVIMAAAW